MELLKLCSTLTVLFTLDIIKSCIGVTYTVREGGIPNAFIGNVGQDFNLTFLMNEGKSLRFNFYYQDKPYVSYFNISEETGDLFTIGKLDRERICRFSSDCDVLMEVVVTSTKESFYQKLKFTVTVEDINDHSPEFPVASVNITISESVLVGTAITIDGASDPDSSEFSVKFYNVTTPGSPFSTKSSRNLDGSSSVQLICDRELDRETIDFYQIQVVAIDGGLPPKTGSLLLNITVTDTNDNSPEFTDTEYNITVKEDIPINSTILLVTARDKDINENGRVTYGLATLQSQEIKDLFTIEPNTGKVKTIGRLIYKQGHRYKIIVEASDAGTQPRTTQSFVYVTVEDVENNPPEISLNLLSKNSYARVSELANLGAVVALFGVSDADIGWNGITNCSLLSNVFALQRSYVNEYKVTVAKPLDRESVSVYNVTVYCHDAGTPPLSSKESFNVSVLDENDNKPVFSKSTYRTELMENNNINDVVISVSASDDDAGVNGDVVYELLGDAWSDFRIEPNTGVIHATKSFNRESKTRYEFHVLAKDGGEESFTSTATVLLEILDQNDNHPKFSKEFYEFDIAENQPSGTVVDRVVAEDKDLDNNGIVTYIISESFEITVPFKLDPSGVLRTKKGLDREFQSRYDFTVIAFDQGSPYRLNSTVNVSVFVTDVNDNSPFIQSPEKSGHSVHLTLSTPVNTPLYLVKAHDDDEGRNAQLLYRIEDRNDTKIFDINDSGQVLVARPIESWETDIYMIQIAVYDNGSPQNFAKTVLIMSVLISNNTGTAQTDEGLHSQNLLIALTVVIVTAVLAATIVVTIFVIRRMDKKKQDFFGGDVNSEGSSEAEVVPGLIMDGNKDFYSRPNNTVQLAPVISHMSLDKSSSSNDFVFKPRMNTPSPANHPSVDSSDGDLQLHETSDHLGRTTPSLNRLTSLRLHQALLQSHDKQWTNHNEPQQTTDIYHQRHTDDSHSQLSGDGDSGRGGSVSDGHSNLSNSHDAGILQLQNIVKQSGRRGTPPHLQKEVHLNDDNYNQQIIQLCQKPNITPRDNDRNQPSVQMDQSNMRNSNLNNKYSNSNSNIFHADDHDREIPPEIHRYHSYRGDRHHNKNNNYHQPNPNSVYARGKSSPGIQMGLSSISTQHHSPSHHRDGGNMSSFRAHPHGHRYSRQSSNNSDNYPPYPMDDKYGGYRDRFDETFDSITTTACEDDDNTTTSGSYTIDNNAAEDFVELNPAQLKDIFV